MPSSRKPKEGELFAHGGKLFFQFTQTIFVNTPFSEQATHVNLVPGMQDSWGPEIYQRAK